MAVAQIDAAASQECCLLGVVDTRRHMAFHLTWECVRVSQDELQSFAENTDEWVDGWIGTL